MYLSTSRPKSSNVRFDSVGRFEIKFKRYAP